MVAGQVLFDDGTWGCAEHCCRLQTGVVLSPFLMAMPNGIFLFLLNLQFVFPTGRAQVYNVERLVFTDTFCQEYFYG